MSKRSVQRKWNAFLDIIDCGKVAGDSRIHDLLARKDETHKNVFYEAKLARGDIEGYQRDIAFAWAAAEETYLPNDSEESSESLALQCRYALITATMHSLAHNIPPAFLGALVEKGIFSPEQGVAQARLIRDGYQRMEALSKLVPHLTQTAERDKVIHETFDVWRSIGFQARISTVFHASNPPNDIESLFRVPDAIESLCSYFPTMKNPREALSMIREAHDFSWQASALAAILPQLDERTRSETLHHLLDIMGRTDVAVSPWHHLVQALDGVTTLIPHLTGQLKNVAESIQQK